LQKAARQTVARCLWYGSGIDAGADTHLMLMLSFSNILILEKKNLFSLVKNNVASSTSYSIYLCL